MSRIRNLRLTNFKGFSALDLELSPLNVFTGINSAGKSSAMQALALLEQSRGQETPGFVLNGDLAELGDFGDVFFDRIERGYQSKPFLGIDIRPTGGKWQKHRGESRSSDADFIPFTDPSGHDVNVPWNMMQFVRADRLGPTLVHRRSHSAVVGSHSVGTHGEYAVHYLLEHRTTRVHPAVRIAGVADTLEEQTGAWISAISRGTRIYPDNLPGVGSAVLRFSNGPTTGINGGREHRATNVGFGLSYALPVIVGALTARRNSLLMVENPEAHLHPSGQRLIAKLCVGAAKAGAQVVLETHSDHVVNSVRIAVAEKSLRPTEVSLYFFDRTNDSGEPAVHRIEIDTDGSLSDWPDGFFDEYVNSLIRLDELSES